MRQGHWAVVDLIGKGGHIRTVPIPEWVKAALDVWTAAAGIKQGKGGNAFLMSGYAYETIPNKPIIAGFTSGPEVAEGASNQILAPTRPLASLGLLALGRDGLNIWRREEEMA